MQQLEQGQQANALNRMKMEEYQRGLQEQNALSKFLPNLNESNRSELLGYGEAGRGIYKTMAEGDQQQATQKARQAEALKTNLANHRSFLVGVNDQPSYDAWRTLTAKNIPELASILPAQFSTETKDSLLKTADDVSKRLTAAPEKAATSADATTMQALGYPLTPDGYRAFRDAQRVERLLTPEEEAQKKRIALASRPPGAPRPEPAPRTQQVTLDDGSLGIVNMDTGVITRSTVGGAPVKGKLSAGAEKSKMQKTQMVKELDQAIVELTDVTKDGGLIDQSTGSGVGRAVDIGARFIGQAMPGDIAIGKLQPIADLSLKMIPRFEGPQSNADTTSYKQAAGQLADPTLPPEIRKAAGKTVLRLMKSRKDQFTTVDMATNAAPDATGESAINAADAILNKTRK
jgi:hypothetical protein